jgi:hypothetical protein
MRLGNKPPVRRGLAARIAVLPLLLGACFPTMQTPEVNPGFHLDAGAMVLGDQVRNGEPQGTDLFGWIAPSFGVTPDVEIGIPIGWYLEEGIKSLTDRRSFGTDPLTPVIMPYGKFALVNSPTDKLAGVVQLGLHFLSSVSVLYGRDLGSWMPYGSVKWMASGGPAGDDPLITRYQESGQLLLIFSGGARWRGPGLPAIEVGVLLNHYREGALYGDFGQPTTPRTLVDLFMSARVRLGARDQRIK